jgi:thiol-disulfide isomerase/thioredoxin
LEWKDLKGKVVLLDFMSDSCVPCVEGIPKLKALDEKFRDKGLVVVCVHHKEVKEGASQIPVFLKKHEIAFPVVVDTGKTFVRYNIECTPTYLLVDKTGKVVPRGGWKFTGPPSTEEIEELLKK